MQGSSLTRGVLAACVVPVEGASSERERVMECHACGLVFVRAASAPARACRRCGSASAIAPWSSAA